MRKRITKPRGIALALTMLFLVLLFLGGLALSTVAVQNMQMVRTDANSAAGTEVAEAGLAQLETTIQATPTYGTNGESPSGSMPDTGQSWWANFSSSGIPANLQSVNNLASSTAYTRSDGSVVAPYTADIIVSTRVGTAGSSRLVSVGLTCTNVWNEAVASSGTFSSTGGLTIRGASTLAVASQVLSGLSSGDISGNMVANSTANPSVSFSGGATISGTVTTPGTVSSSSSYTAVSGTLPIPDVTWSFYTPDLTASTTQVYSSGSTVPNSLGGGSVTAIYVNGPLSISGGLSLNNVSLSVNGSLSISGGLSMTNSRIYTNGSMSVSGGIKDSSGSASSTGSIFVCGSGSTFSVSGSANLSSSNSTGVSVFSQGDVSLSGGSFFQGIVYSHGNVKGTGGATVVGVAIADGNTSTKWSDTGGATFIYCPVYSQVLLQMAGTQMKVRKLSWRMVN